nr:unnamed protein product [Callosobruchus chinensis]
MDCLVMYLLSLRVLA